MLAVHLLVMVLLAGACGSTETAPPAASEAVAATPSTNAPAEAPVSTTVASSTSAAAVTDAPDAGVSPEAQTIVSGLSAAVGGLSDASHDCVVALLVADPSLVDTFLAVGGPVEGPAMLQVLACLTSEEAAALTPPGDGAAPDPAEVGCLMEALSGEPAGERILEVLTGADPSAEGLTAAESAILGEAVQSCDIETGFGDPAAAAGSMPDDGASVGGGWGLCTAWLILYPGDVCEVGELTVAVEGDGTVLLAGSIDGIDVDGMHFDGDIVDIHGLLMAPDGTAWTINGVPQ